MKKIRLGIVNSETWDFLKDLRPYFEERFNTTVFENRGPAFPLLRGRRATGQLRRNLKRFLRSNDVVFFEWASELLALATQLPKSARIVTRLHRWELYHWADSIEWDAVDSVILVSEAKRKEFVHRFPTQESKVVVIPESIDVARFQFSRRPFSGAIGTLCHLRPRKRVYDLVLTCSELLRKDSSLKLFLGGDPVPGQMDYYQSLVSLVARLGLNGSIQFDGYVQDPSQWYRKIDIFVSHSYSEGLQVSPMEAMASGCYVLAHRWDGAEELLPEDLLYFTGSELQAKISRFCAVSETEKARERARLRGIVEDKFDIATNRHRFGEIVESLAS